MVALVQVQALDHFGFHALPPPRTAEEQALRTTYGLCQIVVDGTPDLRRSGRANAAVASLLRGATLSLAASVALYQRRMYEPLVREGRHLLESRLFLSKLRGPDSDRLANLLAADRILARQRLIERSAKYRKVRSGTDPWLRRHFEDIKRAFAVPELRLAKKQVEALASKNCQWYGHRDLSGLARELGEVSAYEQVYGPASSSYVHAGDADVHLEEVAGEVRLRSLPCANDDQLNSSARLAVAEGYALLKAAVAPWTIGKEIRLAIDVAMPLVIVSLDPTAAHAGDLTALERHAPIPRSDWPSAVKVTFDWKHDHDPSRSGLYVTLTRLLVAFLSSRVAPHN